MKIINKHEEFYETKWLIPMALLEKMSSKSKCNKYMKSQAVCHYTYVDLNKDGNLCLTSLKPNLSIPIHRRDYVPYKIKIWIVLGNDKYYIHNSLNKMRTKTLHFSLCPGYISDIVLRSKVIKVDTFPSCILFCRLSSFKTITKD